MNKFKIALAVTVAAVVGTSLCAQPVMAEGGSTESVASIDFVEGGTIIDPGPDGELPDIKNGHIYFGEQNLEGSTKTYSSVTSHDDEDRQYAGFVVRAGNNNGWTVSTQITGFAIEGSDTMKNFALEMIPGEVQTTTGNLGLTPVAHTVKLYGGVDKDNHGASAVIFEAEAGKGLGKWGTNWEGKLTVVGGSVAEQGSASAVMLWTLNAGDVQI